MKHFIVTNNGVINTEISSVTNENFDRSIYEVIRLVEGVALFMEDHFERLLSSSRISGIPLNMQLPEFGKAVEELIKANQQNTGNIKFLLTTKNGINHWTLSFIPHSYPTDKDYQRGVPTGLLYAERSNPEAKVIQSSLRQMADQLIADKKLYEVLLVDRNGYITEGSRSNVFFVKEHSFYTAPASMVLSGVTRKKVLDCLKELNYPLIEQAIRDHDISNYEAVFLTGTSPKVLPIHAVDECKFMVDHPLMKTLMDFYNHKMAEYLQSKKG